MVSAVTAWNIFHYVPIKKKIMGMMMIIITDNFCIALVSGVHKRTALYNNGHYSSLFRYVLLFSWGGGWGGTIVVLGTAEAEVKVPDSGSVCECGFPFCQA